MPGFSLRRPLAATARQERNAAKAGGAAAASAAVAQVEKGVAAVEKGSLRVRAAGARVAPMPLPELEREVEVEKAAGDLFRATVLDSRTLGIQHRFGSNHSSSSSSGSEHEPTSVRLAAMVDNFMEHDRMLTGCGRARCNCSSGICGGLECPGSDEDEDGGCSIGEVTQVLQGLAKCANSAERKLLADVTATLREVWQHEDRLCNVEDRSCSGGCLRRLLMVRLRAQGYNAAVCKSRWEHSRGFPGGDYEYIDVIGESSGSKDRIIVDADFCGQFLIARPTQQYTSALECIPGIFVGRLDRLQQLVAVITDATKRSLQRQAMHLPPWRKLEYMRAKWLAPYKRTINEVPQSAQAVGCAAHAMDASSRVLAMQGLTSSRASATTKEDALDGKGATASTALLELELELDEDIDAVIYKGRVVPVGGNAEGGRRNLIEHALPAKTRDRSFELPAVDSKVTNTNWQPPLVTPKKAHLVRAGLASVFREAGLSRQLKGNAEKAALGAKALPTSQVLAPAS